MARSFITSVPDGTELPTGRQTVVRGVAFDSRQGIREVAYSTDDEASWHEVGLDQDMGVYSFRAFSFGFTPGKGNYDLRARARASQRKRLSSPPTASCATWSSRSK